MLYASLQHGHNSPSRSCQRLRNHRLTILVID